MLVLEGYLVQVELASPLFKLFQQRRIIETPNIGKLLGASLSWYVSGHNVPGVVISEIGGSGGNTTLVEGIFLGMLETRVPIQAIDGGNVVVPGGAGDPVIFVGDESAPIPAVGAVPIIVPLFVAPAAVHVGDGDVVVPVVPVVDVVAPAVPVSDGDVVAPAAPAGDVVVRVGDGDVVVPAVPVVPVVAPVIRIGDGNVVAVRVGDVIIYVDGESASISAVGLAPTVSPAVALAVSLAVSPVVHRER